MSFAVLGVPTSAGAHHAGQDLAPAAFRAAGLVERLGAEDLGDVEGSVWVPDASDATARNLSAVAAVAGRVADAVERAARDDRVLVVLGGDCTLTLGVVAGLRRSGSVALAYVDGDADLNTPETTSSGVLDASGVAHLLGIADNALARVGPVFPLLDEHAVALLGYDPDDVGSVNEQALAARPGLRHATYAELAADPAGLAADARDGLAGERLVVHLDVDVVDGRELALANFPHYGTGVSLEVLRTVLTTLRASDRLAVVVLTEVNPTHDPSGRLVGRYVELLAEALTG
ncbi:arginase family protein [Nocardioides anomalus]|uniref:Arginase family protein n=1 Tax=Nocardioides anomalus TaxID=2712223 RepID=A0A6G6WCW1_9ACTN|nr:arginase family protein [Nocardioides anomalus]QIG42880.1 arginase family protein [Nocardioides anomalus]